MPNFPQHEKNENDLVAALEEEANTKPDKKSVSPLLADLIATHLRFYQAWSNAHDELDDISVTWNKLKNEASPEASAEHPLGLRVAELERQVEHNGVVDADYEKQVLKHPVKSNADIQAKLDWVKAVKPTTLFGEECSSIIELLKSFESAKDTSDTTENVTRDTEETKGSLNLTEEELRNASLQDLCSIYDTLSSLTDTILAHVNRPRVSNSLDAEHIIGTVFDNHICFAREALVNHVRTRTPADSNEYYEKHKILFHYAVCCGYTPDEMAILATSMMKEDPENQHLREVA